MTTHIKSIHSNLKSTTKIMSQNSKNYSKKNSQLNNNQIHQLQIKKLTLIKSNQ